MESAVISRLNQGKNLGSDRARWIPFWKEDLNLTTVQHSITKFQIKFQISGRSNSQILR